jgi:hypothetical protein
MITKEKRGSLSMQHTQRNVFKGDYHTRLNVDHLMYKLLTCGVYIWRIIWLGEEGRGLKYNLVWTTLCPGIIRGWKGVKVVCYTAYHQNLSWLKKKKTNVVWVEREIFIIDCPRDSRKEVWHFCSLKLVCPGKWKRSMQLYDKYRVVTQSATIILGLPNRHSGDERKWVL